MLSKYWLPLPRISIVYVLNYIHFMEWLQFIMQPLLETVMHSGFWLLWPKILIKQHILEKLQLQLQKAVDITNLPEFCNHTSTQDIFDLPSITLYICITYQFFAWKSNWNSLCKYLFCFQIKYIHIYVEQFLIKVVSFRFAARNKMHFCVVKTLEIRWIEI